MDSKKMLRQISTLDCQIKNLLDERATITFLKGVIFDGERVQTSRNNEPPWMKSIERWDELTEVITQKADRFIKVKREIVDRINSLSDERYIKLLTQRYIDYKSLEEIADDMHYTYDYIRKLHGAALRAFNKTMVNQNHG